MKSIILIFALSILSLSCTRESNHSPSTKVKIKLPEQTMSSQSTPLKHSANSSSIWGLEAPVSITAADCFGVYAQIPENGNSTCVDANGNAVISVNRFAGMAKAGSNIEIELPAGKAREIGLVAFKSADGTCASLTDGLNSKNFSAPLTVGKATTDLAIGVTTELPITMSLTDSKSIEKCAGDPLGRWPKDAVCTPTIAKMVSVGSGQLTLEGSCLDSTTGLEIVNTSTQEKHPLAILSTTPSEISAKLKSSLTMSAGVIYNLAISTANAQTTTPISLQIGTSITVKASGTKIGSFITTANHMYAGNGMLLMTNSNIPAIYLSKPYYIGGAVVPGKYYLYHSLWTVNALLKNLTIQEMLSINIIQGNHMAMSTFYFTGSNCTGDMLVPAQSTDALIGKYFLLGSSCSGTYPNGCSVVTPQKIITTPTWQTNVAYASSMGSGYSGDMVTCTSNSSEMDGYVIPSSGYAPLDASDPQPTINNVTISQ